MNELTARLEADSLAAARGKLPELATLRLLKAALHNEAIAHRAQGELTEADVLGVLRKELKKRKEAAELYRQGGRAELADKETAEAAVIARYLPVAPTAEAVAAAVRETAAELRLSGPQAIGPLTKAVVAKFAGAVDGGTVSRAVKEFLQT